MTCAAFSIKFAKTNKKFAENSEFCEKIHYFIVNYSLLSLGAALPGAAAAAAPAAAGSAGAAGPAEDGVPARGGDAPTYDGTNF